MGGGGGSASAAPGTASQGSTLQNLIKPFVGAGILALPSAFKQGGVLASSILMVILAIGTNYCIRCLLHCVDYVHARENGLEYDQATGTFRVAQPQQLLEEDSHALNVNSDPATKKNGSGRSANGNGLTLGAAHEPSSSSSSSHDEDDLREPSLSSRTSARGDRPASPSAIALASPKLSSSSSPNGATSVVVNTVVPGPGTPATPSMLVTHQRERGASLPADQLVPGENGAPPHADPTKAPPVYSFREIGGFAFGRTGVLAVDINLIASQLGFCIAYMSFISQNMDEITPLSREEWLAILFVAWSVLCQVRSIEKLAWTSAMGNLLYAVSLGLIFYDGFKNSCCVPAGEATYFRAAGLPLVFGTGCFALEGIGLVLPVKRAMADQGAFSRILNMAVGIVAFIYVLFGVLGYLFYGEHINSVITKNLTKGALTDSVAISLSLSLFTSFVIQMFPVTEMADKLWDDHVFLKGKNKNADGVERGGEGDTYRSLADDSSSAATQEEGETSGVVASSPTSNYETFKASNNSSNGNGKSVAAGVAHAPLSQSEDHPSTGANGGVQEDGVERWPSGGERHGTNWKREGAKIGTRVLLVGFTAVVSLAFKNFGDIVSLVGSFSNSAIAFILPMVFFIKLVLKHPERSERAWANHASTRWITRNKDAILPYTIIVLGVIASIIGVTTTIQGMIDPPKDE